MTWFLYIMIYILGAIIWYLIEKKFFPYEEGYYKIEFDGAHEQTIDMQRDDRMARCILWPLTAGFMLTILPIVLLTRVFKKFEL